MKNLLIPTDFSACAGYAVDAGMKLGERFGAKIHLLTKVDIPEDWDQLSQMEKREMEESNQIVRNALVLLNNIKVKYPALEITTAYSGGKLIKAIKNYSLEHGIDFIVMGSHGASGKASWYYYQP